MAKVCLLDGIRYDKNDKPDHYNYFLLHTLFKSILSEDLKCNNGWLMI